jgi:hypothetical protein
MARRNRLFETEASVSAELFARLGGSEHSQHNATCFVVAPLKADGAELLRGQDAFCVYPDGLRLAVGNLAEALRDADLLAEPGVYLTRKHWDDPVLRVRPDGISLAGHIRRDPDRYVGRYRFEPGPGRSDEDRAD